MGLLLCLSAESCEYYWERDNPLDLSPTCIHPKVSQNCTNNICTIPPGCFLMGSPDISKDKCRADDQYIAETLHEVTLTHSFKIMQYEVRQSNFYIHMTYNPSQNPGTKCDNCPVNWVSWHEAASYCNKLNVNDYDKCYECSGSNSTTTCSVLLTYKGSNIYQCPGWRLPTEAEWEYAYRGGTRSTLYNGDLENCTGEYSLAGDIAWYLANAGSKVSTIGGKVPNKWGLYDMAGNVWEFVHDPYQKDLGAKPVQDPVAGASSFTNAMLRGGSVCNEPFCLRAADRNYGLVKDNVRHKCAGFRCLRTN